jgi:hypothetical protein
MEHGGRHAYSHRWWLPALLLAVLIASAAAGAGFVGWTLRDDERAGSPTPPTTSLGVPVVPDESGQTLPSRSDNRLEACRAVFAQELQAQLAADTSMAQWQLHIDAMNQLVAGKISLAEATAYWRSTRKGAIHRVHRFRKLDGLLVGSDHACTDVGTKDSRVTACVQATRAVSRSLDAARTATRTWRHHIREMEMLRRGDISPTRALTRWVAMWQSGQDQVERYSHRTTKSLRERCA